MHQPAPVRLERRGDIALIIIDNPPVNASSQAVRQGLFAAVRETIADDQVKAAVIACAGATFVAGADIREFKNAPPPPDLPQVINVIEQSPKPFVAAIHGTALHLRVPNHSRLFKALMTAHVPGWREFELERRKGPRPIAADCPSAGDH